MSGRSVGAEEIAQVIHEISARVAAVHLAVTTLRSGDVDADTRDWMLTTADEETIRLGTDLAGISALVRAVAGDAEPEDVSLADALERAVDGAARGGADASLGEVNDAVLLVRRQILDAVLAILVRLVADTDGRAEVSADATRVTIRRHDGGAWKAPTLAVRLVEALGAGAEVSDDAIMFTMPTGGNR